MIAANGEVVPASVGVASAFNLAYSAPKNICRIAVLFVAGNNAAFAANTASHVKVKPKLFSGPQGLWQRRLVCSTERAEVGSSVLRGMRVSALRFANAFEKGQFHADLHEERKMGRQRCARSRGAATAGIE